ncbi:MAG: ATP-binding cassette domain-containing protein [Bacteroidetes bacterium]|nr:ATP-binding cassette domain-containing protein [Bacteroidota bacterium]
MDILPHCAIIIAPDCDYDWVLDQLQNGQLLKEHITLPNAPGVLFAQSTINRMITEELLHDQFLVTTAQNKSLQSMSSGEQKKTLLQYLIAKQPGFMVIDNVLDNLDTAAQQMIQNEIAAIANHTLIIQVLHRKKDVLPGIRQVFTIQKNKVVTQQSVQAFLQSNTQTSSQYFTDAIPPSLHQYNLSGCTLVELKNVSVQYDGRPIISNISWSIKPGEFWQLIGPNGSGKSTILSLLTGDNPKGYGQNITLFGMKKGSGESVWDIKKNIGYLNATLTQFFPRLDSVEKMLLSGFFDSIGLYQIPNETQQKTALAWLTLLGLADKRHAPFCFLPPGMQRMVTVARAMIKHPPLLILDEPATGLDDTDVELFTALVNKIAAETTTAIIYVAHRPENGLHPQFVYELVPDLKGSVGSMK